MPGSVFGLVTARVPGQWAAESAIANDGGIGIRLRRPFGVAAFLVVPRWLCHCDACPAITKNEGFGTVPAPSLKGTIQCEQSWTPRVRPSCVPRLRTRALTTGASRSFDRETGRPTYVTQVVVVGADGRTRAASFVADAAWLGAIGTKRRSRA
jgi:hypothetical protein